jgi:hypothetical protein
LEVELGAGLVAGLGVNHSDMPGVQIESLIQNSLRGNLKGNLKDRLSGRARDRVNQIVPSKGFTEIGFNRSKSQSSRPEKTIFPSQELSLIS